MSMNPLDAIKLIEDLEFEGLILVSNKNGELIVVGVDGILMIYLELVKCMTN